VNVSKVKSTVVHEAFPAVSANHTGLQAYQDMLRGGTAIRSPDEALTEYFALQVYQKVFGKKEEEYESAYWVPSGGKAPVSDDPTKKSQVAEGRLPAAWTGQLVGILKDVLGVDDETLKELYFKDPSRFATLINGKVDEIQKRWDELSGRQILAWHGVMTGEVKDKILIETINEKKDELKKGEDAKWVGILKTALKAKNVPQAKLNLIWSEAALKKQVQTTLGY
jgi:hypothetical protein